jgi:hypothetical protein
VMSIDYDLKDAVDFQTYAHDSLRLGLETLITGLIETPPSSLSPDDAAQIAPWLDDGLVAHYAGDEVMPADALAESQTLALSTDFIKQLSGVMLQSIYTDLQPTDNTVTIDRATR